MCSCSHYNGLFLRHKIPPNTRLCSWSWQKLTKMGEKWPLWLQLTHSLVSKTPRLIIAQNKSFLAQISMIIGPGLLHMALSASEVLWQRLSCLLIITAVHWCPLVVSSGVWWSLLVSIGVNWCPLVLWWHKQRWRQAAHNAHCVTIVPQLIHLPEFVRRVFVRWRRPLCAEASRQIDRNGSSYHCCCPPPVEMEKCQIWNCAINVVV